MSLQPRPCSTCGAPVRWHTTLGGDVIPLAAEPAPDGNVIVIAAGGGRVRAKILTGAEMPAQQQAYLRHQCPPETPAGPACGVCGQPMDRELARLENWSLHPSCEDSVAAWRDRRKPAKRPPPRRRRNTR